jgi:cell wall-associated protease
VVGTPANAPGVVAVGSTSRHLDFETVSPFSNYGERLDLVAPGAGIFVPVPTTENCVGVNFNDRRNYAYASGTSEAAPYVSGVAALVFAKYDPNNASLATPELAAAMVDKVRAHLLKSVDDLGVPGWDPSFGAGRINAEKALTPASI